MSFDLNGYVAEVEHRLISTFPEHWLAARDHCLRWELDRMTLPFVFYVTNGIIVITREANFDNAFISQFKFPGNLSGPELTEPVLTAFSSLLHRHFYYEIIDRHYSSIPLRPNYTVLVLVREEPVSSHTPYYPDFAPFHSVMIHGHHPHETVLCLMVAGLTPPQLEFPPSTMTPKWRFLECPGDRLKEILSYSADSTGTA